MFRLFPQIKIGDTEFRTVTEVSVTSGWNMFTDTARIVLPGKLQKDGENIVVGENGIFKRGQKAEISLGYFPNADLRFTGYVSAINPESPIIMEFQDIAWILKQGQVKLSFEKVTVKELIDESLKQIIASLDDEFLKDEVRNMKLNIIDATLGSFRTVNGSVNFVGILHELRKVYGLTSFFQDGEMHVGAPYGLDGRDINTHEIIFERNVIDKNLTWVDKQDVRIKVKAISMLPNNTKLELTAGDADGDLRTFFVYNITDEKVLKQMAEREADKFKYEGFRGGFTTFLEPAIQHGDRVKLINKKLPERDGTYQVDQVTTTFGMSGGRQLIKLGPKV